MLSNVARGWRRGRRRWLAGVSIQVAACVVLMTITGLLVLPIPIPFDGRLIKSIETAAHFPLFMAGTFAWAALFQPRRNWPALRMLLLGVLVVAVSFEVIQSLTHRDPDLVDALFSMLGGWAAALLWYSFHTHHRYMALGARALAFLMALTVMIPSSLIVADRSYAKLSFPVLDSFEGAEEAGRWWPDECSLTRVFDHATEGKFALRVVLSKSPGRYPGLFMADVPRNWSGYRQLCFDLYLNGTAERLLWVRADDRPDYPPYADRAQTSVNLSSGPNHVCLDLDSFLQTPFGRPLDRTKLARWGMFFDNALGGESFFIDNIRLLP